MPFIKWNDGNWVSEHCDSIVTGQGTAGARQKTGAEKSGVFVERMERLRLGDAAFPDNTELLDMPEGKDCVMMRLC